jgi:hypothetical protein
MRPVGRYGWRRQRSLSALWLGLALLSGGRWLLLAALWVIRTVGPWALRQAGVTADRIAVLCLLMDDQDRPGVVVGEVVSVRYEDRGMVRS